RNKAASAKYRAKKQVQTLEMRVTIQELSEQNCTLKRQLEDTRKENSRLRSMCDLLRAQTVADKVIGKCTRGGEIIGENGDEEDDRRGGPCAVDKRAKREHDGYGERKSGKRT